MKLSVIIPVHNEERTVIKILNSVLKQKLVYEVVVVDDGSSDNTQTLLKKIKEKRLKVLRHNKNLGKGAAIKTALLNIKGSFVLIQDADLEYSPKEYKKLIKISNTKSVIFGSRIKGNSPHAYERTYFGNVLLTSFCNLLFGTNLTDSYTCYKLVPTNIARSLKLNSKGFEIEAEITAKLAKRQIQIVEVPITYKPRSYEQGKKIKTMDALKGFITFLKVYLYY